MEEMETEELTPDQIYRPKDVVWVKLSAGAMWWPSQVQDMTTLDPEVTEGLKKPPLVVVKFLHEDTYEFVRSFDHIYHYNCKRKEDFLKHGFKKYYKLNNEKNVSMFPEDVEEAERLTGGDPEIIRDPKYLPQEALDQGKVENGGRSSLPADFKRRKASGLRKSAPAPSGKGGGSENNRAGSSKNVRPPIVKQGPTWYPYPKYISADFSSDRKPPSDDPSVKEVSLVRCNSCCFETIDLELLILHATYNQHFTVTQPNRYRWRNPGSFLKTGSKVKKASIRAKKDVTPKSAEKKSPKKKKKDLPPVPVDEFTPPKKSKMSLPGTPNSHDVSQECAKIIEEWTDDEEDSKPSNETAQDLLDTSVADDKILETSTKATGPEKDEEEKPSLNTTPHKADKPLEAPKSSSCFDFDDEPAELGLQSSGKFGQIRLPRVITPEKSKPPDPLDDGNNIDNLLKEVSVPEIPSLPPSKQESPFSRGERTYGSSPFKDTKKLSVTSLVKSDSNSDVNADNEEKHFLAEGPLQSKKRKSFGLTEGAEDGSVGNKKSKVGASPKKPSNEKVVGCKDIDGKSAQVAAKSAATGPAKHSLIGTLTHSPTPENQVTGKSEAGVPKCDERNESWSSDSDHYETSNHSVPHPLVETTNVVSERDGELKNRVELPPSIPCKTSEESQKAPVCGVSDKSPTVDEGTDITVTDQNLASILLGRSPRRSSRIRTESQILPPTSEETETKAAKSNTTSTDNVTIDAISPAIQNTLTVVPETPTPATPAREKATECASVASNLYIQQEEYKQSPKSRRSRRNKSDLGDVPRVSFEEVTEKPSQQVPEQSKLHSISCRKSDRATESLGIPNTTKPPNSDIQKADDIIQPKARETKLPEIQSDIVKLATAKQINRGKSASSGDVGETENASCQVLPDLTKPLASKDEALQPVCLSEHGPSEEEHQAPSPSSRRIKESEKPLIPEPEKLSPSNELSEDDEGGVQQKSQGVDEPRKPCVGNLTSSYSVIPPKLNRRNNELKSGPSQGVIDEQVKSPHQVVTPKDDIVQKVLVDDTKSDEEVMQKSDVILDGAPMSVLLDSPLNAGESNLQNVKEDSASLKDKDTLLMAGVVHHDFEETSEPAKMETTEVTGSVQTLKSGGRSTRGKSSPQIVLEHVKLPQGEGSKLDNTASKKQPLADSDTFLDKEECWKTDVTGKGAGESIHSPTTSRKSTRSKTLYPQEKDESKIIAEVMSQSKEEPEASTVINPDPNQSTPKPSRRSVRNKAKEPANSAFMQSDEKSKRAASPEELETPRSSRSSKKFRSSKETLEPQKILNDTTFKADTTQESAASTNQILPSNALTHEPVVQKSLRSSKQIKKLGSGEELKVEPKDIKSEGESDEVLLDIVEPLKSHSRVITPTEPPKFDEPKSSQRSQRYRSQEVPVSIPLPEDCLPKTLLKSKSPQETAESLRSPACEASSPLLSPLSPKFESSESIRRSKRISSQEVPVSISLPKGDFPNDTNSSKVSQDIPQARKSLSRDESPQDSSKVNQPTKANKKSKKPTSTQEVPVSIPLPEESSMSTQAHVQSRTTHEAALRGTLTVDSAPTWEDAKPKTSPSTVPETSAEVVSDGMKGNEKIRSCKKSTKQGELKPAVLSKGVSMASELITEACIDSKSQSLTTENPKVGSTFSTRSEPLKPTAAGKAMDSKANELNLPSERSIQIPSREQSITMSACEVYMPNTSSDIPKVSLKAAEQLPSDVEGLLSIQEVVPPVKEHPALTPKNDRTKTHETPEVTPSQESILTLAEIVMDQETSIGLDKKEVEKMSNKDLQFTSKQRGSVPKDLALSKSWPKRTPEQCSGPKKSLEVAKSRSMSKEAKSKDRGRRSDQKSHREEKSRRPSMSASKYVKDTHSGSSREDKSHSEPRGSKRESAYKEKQKKDKEEENRVQRLKPNQDHLKSKDYRIGANQSASSIKQVTNEIAEKIESLPKEEVVKETTFPSKDNEVVVGAEEKTGKLVQKDSPRKKRSKWDETPKVEEVVTAVTSKTVESTPMAVSKLQASGGAEAAPLSILSKPSEIMVFDTKNEIVVDTVLPSSSPKKQMVHSPSKTFRQDEAASLLEELLGSSPTSSPTSSPKKAKSISPVSVKEDSPVQRTADIKFSLSPSKVLDFGSPVKDNNIVDSASENCPASPSKTFPLATVDSNLTSLAAPVKASRWDSPFLGKSTLSTASPVKTLQSPGRKVKTEIISGLSRSCVKTSATGKNVVMEVPPKMPIRIELDSFNNQSDDELSALQAEIMSYSEMGKAKSTPVAEVEKEASDGGKKMESSPAKQSATSTKSLLEKAQDEKEKLLSPSKPVDTKTSSHVSPQGIQRATPVKLPGLSEADLLASLDDAYSFPLDEPVTTESIKPLASDTVPGAKPSSTPIVITVPSDSTQGMDSAVKIVGTERQAIGDSSNRDFVSGGDLLGADLDINSIPFIMPDDLTQEESMLAYSEATVVTPSTATSIPGTEQVSSIPLPSEEASEQLPPIHKATAAPTTSKVTFEQVNTTSAPPVTPLHSSSLHTAPEPKDIVKEEIIETEIVTDHSETEEQNSETPALSLEEKFQQVLVKQPWLRPDLLQVLTEGATEKEVFEARKVTQLVISLYDEDHPDYSYYMSLPPCQVGTSNSTKSWAAVRPSTTAMVTSASSASKMVAAPAKPTLTSANSVRQLSTGSRSMSRQVLSVDKSKSVVTVVRPEKVGEVIFADSSTKPVVVSTQTLTPVTAVRLAGSSPVKTSPAQVKQHLLQLFNKAQSGELDAETARKLNAITSNADFMAKINKQQKVVVTSRPSADVKVQPSTLVAKTPILRATATAKIVSSISGSPVMVSQSKPITVAAVSTPGTQPKLNILPAATRSEPLKFTMESKFMNIQIASNSPKYVVACDPVTGVPAVKPQIVIGRNASATGAGPSRSTVPNTMQTVASARSVPTTAQAIVMSSGLTVTSKAQTVNLINPASSSVKALPSMTRPRIVQRLKTVTQTGSVPSARLSQPQTVRILKQTLPQGQTQIRPSKAETITYVTLTNNMVVPTTSEQVYVMNKTKPTAAAGSDLLAKALAGADILPNDPQPFTEDPSTDLFSPASVVVAGSLGADQLSTMSLDPVETDNVNR